MTSNQRVDLPKEVIEDVVISIPRDPMTNDQKEADHIESENITESIQDPNKDDVEMNNFTAGTEEAKSEPSPIPDEKPITSLEIDPDDSPAVKAYKELALEREHYRMRFYDKTDDGECFHSSAPMRYFTKYRPSQSSWQAIFSPFHPLWVFIFFAIVPPGIVGLIYGGIPVNDPRTTNFALRLPYLLVFVPLTFTSYIFLINVFWLALLEIREQGIKVLRYLIPTLTVLFTTTSTMLLILPWVNPFPAIGMIPYMAAIVTYFLTLFVFRRIYSSCNCGFFPARRWTMIKIILLTCITFMLFVGYTLVYRQISAVFQRVMTGVSVFVLYMLKKVCLTVTDEISYELSFLFSGFAIQSIFDIFFTFAYPNVQDPLKTFTIIFFITSGTDYLYLFLLTSRWMRLRVWIKGRLKALLFCSRYDPLVNKPIWDDLYRDDRGQTNLRPGYARRQIQFFYYRIVSGIFAQIFFLIVAPIFRNWSNRAYFPFFVNSPTGFSHQFEPLPENAFRNACIYSLARLGSLVILIPISYYIIKRWLAPVELREMMENYRYLLVSKRFIFFIAVALMSNELLCAWMGLLHNEIWFIDTK